MHIVFVHYGLPVTGNVLATGPLGGTETAMIGVAQALATNPENRVFVFTNTRRHHRSFDVEYFPVSQLGTWSREHRTDVLISIRSWIPLVCPMEAKMRIYFSPDAFTQPFPQYALSVALPSDDSKQERPILSARHFFGVVDKIFCVGTWQAETFIRHLGYPRRKVAVTRNAVFHDYFNPQPLAQRSPTLVYAGTPFRGLEYLPDYYMAIRKLCPNVRMEICSSMALYSTSTNDRRYDHIFRSLEQVGAVSHGAVPQAKLAQILCRSRLFVYPNTFAETFCISALEAQAAGLPVITSRLGSLPERVTHGFDGFLVSGHPRDPRYRKKFVSAVVKLLTDDDLWLKMSARAINKADGYTYDGIARKWETLFTRGTRSKASRLPRKRRFPSVSIPHPMQKETTIVLSARAIETLVQREISHYGFA